jgi:hypothetical protein
MMETNRTADLQPMTLIKSKKRVADHGEVFTPNWLVENMLDLVKGEAERIDSRFLEPACGSGNFLVPVLKRKLAAVEAKYSKSDFEKRQFALLAVMCTYGIELLADNIAECRANMLEVWMKRMRCIEPLITSSLKISCTVTRSPCSWMTDSPSPSPSGATSAKAGSSGATSASKFSRKCPLSAGKVRSLPTSASMKFLRPSRNTGQ